MNISKKDIKECYTATVYQRGLQYYQKNYIVLNKNGEKHRLFLHKKQQYVETLVEGSEAYQVIFPVENGALTDDSMDHASCSCPHFESNGWQCKHIVAALLSYLEHGTTPPLTNTQSSNYYARNLLQTFTNTERAKDFKGEIQLKPKFSSHDSDYPHLSFSVGKDKMYVVKRIDQFLERIESNEDFSYGKDLGFPHYLSQFDETSQKLIQILSGLNNQSTEYVSTRHFSNGGRNICLDGNSFQLFFQLYAETQIDNSDKSVPSLLLLEANPKMYLHLQKMGDGATVTFSSEKSIQFFGNEVDFYAITNGCLLHCSPEFTEKVYPLMPFFDEELFISEEDLPTLCATVISTLETVMEIEDKEDLCLAYAPDDCTACFYFDSTPDRNISVTLKFRYGETEYPQFPTQEQAKSLRRNSSKEQRAQMQLEEYFLFDKDSHTYLLNIMKMEEEEFLTEILESYRDYGDIYLSTSLKARFVETSVKPSLGISVSEGILSLDMDIGDFPLSELEALYNSFLKKKKYHKLTDGRFLFLEGSGYEKVAEITHMLQLSPKDIQNNQINLPAYRGLYLDSVLEANEEVDSTRNLAFRRMMKDFKSVADSDYQPPDSLQTTLRPYQVLGFQWMKTLEQYGFGGILADEMGLGKTVQVITYLLSLEQGTQPSLIVCPASLLLNWGEELQRFAPSLSKILILGNAKERKEQLDSPESKEAQVWVTSYDLLKRDRELYQALEFRCCVLDEAQNIKNQSTLVSKTVKSLVCKQRFVLTGTPIENRLSELWNLFDFLMPGYLFKHNTFVSKLEKPIVQSGDVTAGKQLSLLVKPFILRRVKKDVLKDLPDKVEHVRKIHLSEEERKLYLAATISVKSQAQESKNKLQILALLTQLRQLCCDPNLCFENYEGESSKLLACMELCQSLVSNGHKILLFSQFTTMLDILRSKLDEENIRHLTIEGSTSKEKRAKHVKEFQNGQADVFLISLKAGGTGLNLTNADVVIHYDPWWNQASQNQATDRAHRIGQKQHVQVYKLIAQGTIEEKILELQDKKAQLMESVLDETLDDTLSQEEILALLD